MKIAIIGAGNMGGAIALGLAASPDFPTEDIYVSNPSVGKLNALKDKFPEINVSTSNREVAARADMVMLVVKPWKVAGVMAELADILSEGKIIASVAGGVDTAALRQIMQDENISAPSAPLFYIIPNTALAIGESMTFLTSENSWGELDEEVTAIFNRMGKALFVEPRMMHAGMAVASCGIAYAMRYIRAVTTGGVELGLYPRDAQAAVVQTLIGAAKLLEANGSHPEAEIDKVTTAGGITIRGLNAMEEAGFTGAVVRGLKATS